MRSLLTVLALAASVTAAMAGASSRNFPPPPQPDPTTLNMTRSEAKGRVLSACLATQSNLQGKPKQELYKGCNCYAGRTVDQMTKAEFENFRTTSYFDDTTREKALRNIDSCRLQRPI